MSGTYKFLWNHMHVFPALGPDGCLSVVLAAAELQK